MKKLSDLIKKLFFKFARLIKYGLVGIINTLVDYGVFTLVYQLAGLEAGPSQILGFMCGSRPRGLYLHLARVGHISSHASGCAAKVS